MNWRILWIASVAFILTNGLLAINGVNVVTNGTLVFAWLAVSIVCAAFMSGDYDEGDTE